MNAMDLLVGFGSVKDSYVIGTEEFRQGKQKAQRKRLSIRKMWLIAAVIALTLLLVGCAIVYVLSLQNLAIGEEYREYYDGSSESVTILSVQGVKGTPGYQAAKEWREWLQTYDQDQSVFFSEEAYAEDFGDEYYAYNLYSREMKDKLDEICAKYNLKLLGKLYVDPDETAACQALQIQGILRPGVQAETNFGGMHYYACGAFGVEGTMTLTAPDTPWPYEEIVSFDCYRKDYFSEITATVGAEGSYEEWTYTTSNGVDVLMVLEQRNENLGHVAQIFADCGDYVFIFSAIERDRVWTKEALESYAEAFDFTVQPQPVSQESLAEAEDRREAAAEEDAIQLEKKRLFYRELGYDSRIKSRMELITHPSQLGFWVTDLNGDGVEELIVGENGYITAVYCKQDGGTQYLMPLTIASPTVDESNNYLSGIGTGFGFYSYIYLCENNTLAYVSEGVDVIRYFFAEIQNGEYVWGDCVFYSPNSEYYKDNPWNMIEDTSTYLGVPITEERFYEIIRSHPRVPVTLTPISQYPLADTNPSGIVGVDEVFTNYKDLFQKLSNYAEDSWRYCTVDLDGDGQEEVFLTQGLWNGVLTIKNGKVKILECGKNLSICNGKYIAYTREYLDGNSAPSYYKVQNGNAVLVDYLRYDKDKNPDNPWFYSMDAQDDSLMPISQEQYESVQAKYVPLELEMLPLSAYSLS